MRKITVDALHAIEVVGRRATPVVLREGGGDVQVRHCAGEAQS
jgi:hypothetical protein